MAEDSEAISWGGPIDDGGGVSWKRIHERRQDGDQPANRLSQHHLGLIDSLKVDAK